MSEIQKYLVVSGSSIANAIDVIDRASAQIALVVDNKNALLGTVTDGDVRRAILRGEQVENAVESLMCRDFISLPTTATKKEALNLMRKVSVNRIPVLDKHGKVVDLFLLEELMEPKKIENPVLIMAGGQGKRLLPLTKNCPKPMLNVSGKPILEIILEQCIKTGFVNFFISVYYLKNQIKDYFGDGSKWGVNIEYIEEQGPLGTAGALSLLEPLPDQPILVLNGDVLTKVDFASLLRYFTEQKSDIVVCLREEITKIPYGVAELVGEKIVSINEKPEIRHNVNAGVYLIGPEVLRLLPRNEYMDMPQLIHKAVECSHAVNAFPIHEYWLDIGQIEMLERAHGEWI